MNAASQEGQGMGVNALSAELSRQAFHYLKHWGSAGEGTRIARHDAMRELPLLIRRHGLRMVLRHWLALEEKESDQRKVVAESVVDSLRTILGALPSDDNAFHMAATRLALELIDQWMALSESMLKDSGGNAQSPCKSSIPDWPDPPTIAAAQPGAERNGAYEFFNLGVPVPASSEQITILFDRICGMSVDESSMYGLAYRRWKASLSQGRHVSLRKMTLTHRALIGLSEANLWESGISMCPVHGVPRIAGTAMKGLAAHFAQDYLSDVGGGLSDDARRQLFGHTEIGAGRVSFHDAWWVPGGAQKRPFVREVVTPHHPDFLNRKSLADATPFDAPTPVPQLAAHGQFLVAVEGEPVWADHALDILQLALEMEGVGARTPEYGQATLAVEPPVPARA